jgi:hypothetical protein
VLKLGAAAGYWPCLGAPYVQIFCGLWIVELWLGAREGAEAQSNN